ERAGRSVDRGRPSPPPLPVLHCASSRSVAVTHVAAVKLVPVRLLPYKRPIHAWRIRRTKPWAVTVGDTGRILVGGCVAVGEGRIARIVAETAPPPSAAPTPGIGVGGRRERGDGRGDQGNGQRCGPQFHDGTLLPLWLPLWRG